MKRTSKSHKRSTKLLALLLSVLMILGAMPLFTFAADGDTATDEIVTKWPTSVREIEYGQTVAEAGLNDDGEATIPGHFEYKYPTSKPGVGDLPRDAVFVPDDTGVAPVEGTVNVTILQSKSAIIENGKPKASPIQIGQKLKVSELDKTGVKFTNYGKVIRTWTCTWKEPEKVMNEIGTFTETIICAPKNKLDIERYAPVEVTVEVTVNEIDPDKVWLEEIPTFTEPMGGLTLGECCKLTGGLVTKGGKEIPGTWAWKNPDYMLVTYTSGNQHIIFTPDDPTACDPIDVTVFVAPQRDAMIIISKLPVASSIELGQTLADSTLTGGEATYNKAAVIGTFSWKDPTVAPATGTADQTAIFTPDDSSVANPVEVQVPVTVHGPEVKESPSCTSVELGYKVGDSILSGGLVVKGDRIIPGTWAWKEPDKVVDNPNGLQTYAIFTPTDSKECAPFEVQVTIAVGEYTVVEFPTIEKLIPGAKYGDYKLNGGLVTKAGKPIDGTWAWKEPGKTAEVGDYKQSITFDPNADADGATGCYDYSVNVEKIPLEIQWPDIKGYYAVGGIVGENISGYQGTANIPGRFDIYYESYGLPVPDKVGGTADVKITFDPVAKGYEMQSKVITVTFEAPEPFFGVKVNADKNEKNTTNVRCSIGYTKNWPLHTGKFYLVIDGERHTEITELSNMGEYQMLSAYLRLKDLPYGEHEFSCEYVAGENDVYKSAKSDPVKFMVVRYCDLTVVHYGGGTVTNTYAVGSSITVSARNHDKPYYVFDKWTVEGAPLAEGTDTTQQEMTFVMPDGDVKLTATYKLDFGSFIKYGFQKVVSWFIGFIPQVIEFIKGLIPQQ